MPLKLDGTYGVSGIDGTASTPSLRGSDLTGNGIVYGTDTVQIATGGTTAVTVDSSQNVGIGTATINNKLEVGGAIAIQRSTNTARVSKLTNENGNFEIIADSSYNMIFNTGGTERARIDSSGNLLVTGGGGLGYGTGSGGTVTQGAGSGKSTAVTLNKTTGKITMNNAALAASTTVQFTVNNTTVTNNDTIIVNLSGGTADGKQYNVWAWPDTNVFYMIVRNISAVSLSEALVINFAVIKGATS